MNSGVGIQYRSLERCLNFGTAIVDIDSLAPDCRFGKIKSCAPGDSVPVNAHARDVRELTNQAPITDSMPAMRNPGDGISTQGGSRWNRSRGACHKLPGLTAACHPSCLQSSPIDSLQPTANRNATDQQGDAGHDGKEDYEQSQVVFPSGDSAVASVRRQMAVVGVSRLEKLPDFIGVARRECCSVVAAEILIISARPSSSADIEAFEAVDAASAQDRLPESSHEPWPFPVPGEQGAYKRAENCDRPILRLRSHFEIPAPGAKIFQSKFRVSTDPHK